MNRYLEKVAAVLRKHQEEALRQLDKEDGVVVHHGTGSGKTLLMGTAIERAQKKDKTGRVLFIAPASLITNLDKEILKHGLKIDKSRLDVRSYEKAVRNPEQLSKNKYMLAIADEGHRLRNRESQRSKVIGELMRNADKRMISTATGNYNHLADISPLVNIVSKQKLLPEDKSDMMKRYTRTKKDKPSLIQRILNQDTKETTVLKNHEELKGHLQKWVHHYDVADDPKNADKFPTKEEKIIETEMSSDQLRMYKFMEGDVPFLTRMKIRRNLPLSKQEKANLNAFSSGIRQASNHTGHLMQDGGGESGGYTPKIHKAVHSIKKGIAEDKNFRGLVYSNWLDAGIHPYSRKLTEEGISHSVYTGQQTPVEKDQMIRDYNEGRKKVLLVSSSGAEGLDLRGTKKIQILEPHFNPSKIRQVVGRGVRFESHAHLPPKERHVEIEHYLSVHKKPWIGKPHTSIDRYLTDNSDERQVLFESVKDLMKG